MPAVASNGESSPLDDLGEMITGSWTLSDSGEFAGASLHIVPIKVEGADHTFYVEHSNANDLHQVDRQDVWQLYDSAKGARLRVLGFERDGGQRLQIVGMWAVPDLLPTLSNDELFPRMEMTITPSGEGFAASTEHRYPTNESGAMEVESSMEFSDGTMVMHATGYKADGSVAFGDEGAGWRFTRYEPEVPVERKGVTTPGGEFTLVLIDLTPGEGEGAAQGDVVSVDYAGWNEAGELFDTSRVDYRQALSLRLPGQVIAGWNEGLLGIKKGMVRRLVIPPELGYGPRRRSAQIAENETLYFEVECNGITRSGEDQ